MFLICCAKDSIHLQFLPLFYVSEDIYPLQLLYAFIILVN